MSLSSSSSSCDRNKCGEIWFMRQIKRVLVDKPQYQREHPLKKLIDRPHIPPCLFMSREDDDDVRGIGAHDFRSILLYPILSNLTFLRWSSNNARSPERLFFFHFYAKGKRLLYFWEILFFALWISLQKETTVLPRGIAIYVLGVLKLLEPEWAMSQ